MQKAKAQEPEEDGVVDDKAVDDAQQQLAIAEQGDGGRGVVAAVDEGQTIEKQHDGRGEAVVTLDKHGNTKQGTSHSRNKEVEQATADGLVEGEGLVDALSMDIRAHGDGGERNHHQDCRSDEGIDGVGGCVDSETLD